MDACEAVFSPHDHKMLIERICTSICNSVCGEGLLVAVIGQGGEFRAGSERLCSDVFANQSTVDSLLPRIADGQDPVTFCTDDFGLVAGQLYVDKAGLCFAVIGLKGHSLDEMAACSHLTETLLNQFNTIAGLITAETSAKQVSAIDSPAWDPDLLVCLN